MNPEEKITALRKKVMELESLDCQLEELTSLSVAFDEAFMEGHNPIENYRTGFRLFTRMLCSLNLEHNKLLNEFFATLRAEEGTCSTLKISH